MKEFSVLSCQFSVKAFTNLPRTEKRELRTLLFCRFLRPFRQRAQEGVSLFGSVDVSFKRRLEGHHAAVKVASAALVLLDDGAGKFETGEESAGTRVGQDLGAHFPIGIGGSVAADGAGGDAGICSKFELAGEQVVHAAFVHDEHDDVGRLGADLQAETATADGEEGGRAPSLGSAATGDTSAVAGTEDESSVEQRGDDGDALGRSEHFLRNALIGSGLNFVEHGAGCVDASGSLGDVGGFGVFVSGSGKDRRLETHQETKEQQKN